jgi:hypothetical protein
VLVFYENDFASGIEAVSFCEVERSKRYSRKPGLPFSAGDAMNINIQFFKFQIPIFVELLAEILRSSE